MEHEKLVEKSVTYCINVAGGKVESLRVKEDMSTVIRAYDGGKIGIAGRYGEGDDEALLAEAKEKLSLGIPYPCKLAENEKREENALTEIVPKDRFVSTFKALLGRLNATYPAFIFSNKIILTELDTVYENSRNTRYAYKGSTLSIVLCIKSRSSANIMDLSYESTRNSYSEDRVVEDIGVLLGVYDNKVALPEERVPVIISERVFVHALYELIAEKFASGASLFSGKLGQKIFSEKLTVRSDVAPTNRSAIPFFDAEGTVGEDDRFYYIKDGCLTGVITSKRSAEMFSLPVSGGATADFDGVPQAGVAGFGIEPQPCALKELVKGKAIFVWETAGGDMTPDGNIGLPVMLAYLYEDGKLIGRLPEFSLNANVNALFGEDFIGAAMNTVFKDPVDRVIAGYFQVNAN